MITKGKKKEVLGKKSEKEEGKPPITNGWTDIGACSVLAKACCNPNNGERSWS
jgi:hypothetical protein